jgi:hypothetical protein
MGHERPDEQGAPKAATEIKAAPAPAKTAVATKAATTARTEAPKTPGTK